MDRVAAPVGRTTAGALWHLMRPAGAGWVAALTLLGFGFGHWNRALPLREGAAMIAVFGAWVCLHAGAMWLNAALDRDEGEVLMGRTVPVPDGIVGVAYLALAVAVALASAAHPVSGLCAAACATLAVLYSHPATAWKGHPVGGPAVNLLGYGLLSPLAGWVLVDTPFDARTGLAGGLVVLWVGGCYLAAQSFQGEEDAARGYRTLVVSHGPRVTLIAARGLLGLAFVGTMTLSALGWFPRSALLAAPGYVRADRHLVLWARQPGGGDARWAEGLVRRLLEAGALLIACVTVEYAWLSLCGLPTAGLGTVAGVSAEIP